MKKNVEDYYHTMFKKLILYKYTCIIYEYTYCIRIIYMIFLLTSSKTNY